MAPSLLHLLRELSEEARSLVAPHNTVPVVQGPLSPLEFYRDYVAQNRPCVIQGAIDHWPALATWTNEYLVQAMGEREVHVDFTPDGKGDAVVTPVGQWQVLESPKGLTHREADAECPVPPCSGNGDRSGQGGAAVSSSEGRVSEGEGGGVGEGAERVPESERWFTTPFETRMSFPSFLDVLASSRRDSSQGVPYAQHQNSSLVSDFSILASDVADGVPFATAALGSAPEATNFWLGDERAETSWHKDHYDNLYAVVAGQKHFRLLPPCDFPLMCVREYPAARYWRPKAQEGPLYIVPERPRRMVPWASVDASLTLLPGLEAELPPQFSFNSEPVVCTLNEGEVLYLPSMWFHHVTQTPDQAGRTIAVNFWYDMVFDMKYAYYKLVEGLTSVS